MGRDYVTIREEQHDGETVWAETSVGRALLKSAPARVTRGTAATGSSARPGARRSRRRGAGRRRPVDAGDASTESEEARVRLEVLVAGLADAAPGEHTITSRATDTAGQRPAGDGRSLHRQEADLLGEQRPGHPAGQHRLTGDFPHPCHDETARP